MSHGLPPDVVEKLEEAIEDEQERKKRERREATKYGAQIESEDNDNE